MYLCIDVSMYLCIYLYMYILSIPVSQLTRNTHAALHTNVIWHIYTYIHIYIHPSTREEGISPRITHTVFDANGAFARGVRRLMCLAANNTERLRLVWLSPNEDTCHSPPPWQSAASKRSPLVISIALRGDDDHALLGIAV